MSTSDALAGAIGRLDHWLSQKHRRGDVAEIRRLNTESPDRPAFWKAISACLPDDRALSEDEERRWARVLAGMARMAPGGHDPHARLGVTLCEAGWSELRLSKLLSAPGESASILIRRLASFLAAREMRVNWIELAALLLATHPDKVESIRRRVASDYYRTLNRQNRKEAQS